MTFNTTRLHKTWFQEVTFLKKITMLKLSQYSTFRYRIQSLESTQLEYTSKIIMVDVKNSSFGYDLTIGNLVKRGLFPCCLRTFWFHDYHSRLEENASPHSIISVSNHVVKSRVCWWFCVVCACVGVVNVVVVIGAVSCVFRMRHVYFSFVIYHVVWISCVLMVLRRVRVCWCCECWCCDWCGFVCVSNAVHVCVFF